MKRKKITEYEKAALKASTKYLKDDVQIFKRALDKAADKVVLHGVKKQRSAASNCI